MEKQFDLSDIIRTPLVDEIYRKDHLETIRLVSKSMTDEEREEMKDNAFNIEQELEDVRIIQEDFINWALKDGKCDCLINRIMVK